MDKRIRDMLRAKKSKKAPVKTQKVQPIPQTKANETINLSDIRFARTIRNKTTALLSSFLHMPDIVPIDIDQSLLIPPVVVKTTVDSLKASQKIPEKVSRSAGFKSSKAKLDTSFQGQHANPHRGPRNDREAASFSHEVPSIKARSPPKQAPRVHDSFIRAQGSLPKPRATVAGKRPPTQRPLTPEEDSLKIETGFSSRPEKKFKLNSQNGLPRFRNRDNELMYINKVPSTISSTNTPPNLQAEEYKPPHKQDQWR